MKILLIALGTRGDVQPALALAAGLRDAGHAVTVAASLTFKDWIVSQGFAYGEIPVDIEQIMTSDAGKDWVESGSNPLKELQNLKRAYDTHAADMFTPLSTLTAAADVVLSGFTTYAVMMSVAAHHHKPLIATFLQPMLRTRNAAATLQPFVARGEHPLNRLSGRISQWAIWHVANASVQQTRAALGMGRISRAQFLAEWEQTPMLIGVSPHVTPAAPDFPPQAHVTGYWFLNAPQDWQPPATLTDFLNAGSAPVYLGFGSMSSRNAQATTRLMLDAVAASGQRAIVNKGVAGLSAQDIPHNVYLLDGAPHDWLFPRCVGVVHHGGAGTTAAALRAGVPSTVIPHFSDQPYWARRVHELGVGTAPIPREKLTVERLSAALVQLATDDTLRTNAHALREKILAEDGVSQAVALVERYAARA